MLSVSVFPLHLTRYTLDDRLVIKRKMGRPGFSAVVLNRGADPPRALPTEAENLGRPGFGPSALL